MASYYSTTGAGAGAGTDGGGSEQSSGGGFYNQHTFTPPHSGGYPVPNMQQWMPHQPSQSQQTHQQQQQYEPNQMQPQISQVQVPSKQSSFFPSFWNPAAAATMAATAVSMAQAASAGSGPTPSFSNDAVFDFASNAGRSFLQSGTARMIPGLESAMLTLRSYFAVDNRYVLRKIKIVLFPFATQQWRRSQKESPGPNISPSYGLPHVDDNAPDLYIPTMSLVTYVLLCALVYGTTGQFNPEVIPTVTTKCCVTQLLEVLAFRLGFYIMQAPIAFLDLFAYTGYKYLGLCVNMMTGLLSSQLFFMGTRGFYVSMLWTASAASFFILKTMANNIPMKTAATGPKREVMVLVFAVSQFLTMWFVSQTKFLDDGITLSGTQASPLQQQQPLISKSPNE